MTDLEQLREFKRGEATARMNEHNGTSHVAQTWFQSQAYKAGYEVGVIEARAEKAARGEK